MICHIIQYGFCRFQLIQPDDFGLVPTKFAQNSISHSHSFSLEIEAKESEQEKRKSSFCHQPIVVASHRWKDLDVAPHRLQSQVPSSFSSPIFTLYIMHYSLSSFSFPLCDVAIHLLLSLFFLLLSFSSFIYTPLLLPFFALYSLLFSFCSLSCHILCLLNRAEACYLN